MNTRHVPPSATLGIDLASQPSRTAACRINWSNGQGQAQLLPSSELSDAGLLAAMLDTSATRIAIDAPFGWPTEFVRAVKSWQTKATWPLGLDPEEAQLPLVLRSTDRDVWRGRPLVAGADTWTGTGRRPLSVSTDRIAFAAMRCARLLHALCENDGLHWPRRDGLKWPHLASVVVGVDVA